MKAAQDIQDAKVIELWIAAYAARRFGGAIWPNGEGPDKFKDFTLLQKHFYEVKCDLKAAETGNLFFETYNCRLQEPSGLTVSRAECFLHFVPPDKLFAYDPKRMLSHLEQQSELSNHDYKFLKACGDNNSDGFIVPIREIQRLIQTVKWIFEETIPVPPALLEALNA